MDQKNVLSKIFVSKKILSKKNKGIARIIVAKHRNGETGESLLHWAARYTSFENLAPNDPAYDNPAFSNKN